MIISNSGKGLSTTELMVWLGDHMDGVTNDVKRLMNDAEARKDAVRALQSLKDEAVKATTQEEMEHLALSTQEVMEDLKALGLGDLAGELLSQFKGDIEKAVTGKPNGKMSGPEIDGLRNITASFATNITPTIDELGKDDQLEMIRLQDAMAKMSQAENLMSNMISSRNQTAASIVGNIRA